MNFLSFFKKSEKDNFKNRTCSFKDINKMEVDIIICPEGKGKDKIYSISSIQIPNVVTQGKNIEEAKMRLKEALNLYLEDAPKQELIHNYEINNAPMISRMYL